MAKSFAIMTGILLLVIAGEFSAIELFDVDARILSSLRVIIPVIVAGGLILPYLLKGTKKDA